MKNQVKITAKNKRIFQSQRVSNFYEPGDMATIENRCHSLFRKAGLAYTATNYWAGQFTLSLSKGRILIPTVPAHLFELMGAICVCHFFTAEKYKRGSLKLQRTVMLEIALYFYYRRTNFCVAYIPWVTLCVFTPVILRG